MGIYRIISGGKYQYPRKAISFLTTDSGRAVSQAVIAGGPGSSPGQFMWDLHGRQDGNMIGLLLVLQFMLQILIPPLLHMH
jgi:hypothetical protein